MATQGIKFGDLNQLTTVEDTDYLLATDNSDGTSKKLDVSVLSNHIKSGIPAATSGFTVVDALPGSASFGDAVALTTDNNAYFYDGTSWRRLYFAAAPSQPGDPDTDWDKVQLRLPMEAGLVDVKNTTNPLSITNVNIVGAPLTTELTDSVAVAKVDNGYITYPSIVSADWSGQWCVEGWFYLANIVSSEQDAIFSVFDDANIGINKVIGVTLESNGTNITFKWVNTNNDAYSDDKSYNSDAVIGATLDATINNNWAHLAITRNASAEIVLFINGQPIGDARVDNDIKTPVTDSHPFYLGFYKNQAGDTITYDGFMNDVRVTMGDARYTAPFTPPTQLLPVS